MRKPIVLLSLVMLSACSPLTLAAVPAPSDKPVKWEYLEIAMRARGAGRGAADEAQQFQPEQKSAAAIRLITSGEEIDAKSWEDLAEKLKAPPPAKEATTASHKLRVFDRLGSDGWELVTSSGGSTGATATAGSWMFKRRIP